ncbi:adenylate isopentenyltransferase 5, chloroplastic-like [Arachis stenosperma]|uniref:adenylate isopentenyltransferase 5, chloroplastic-like n=1 Tax=Arachis stenosperma TaxID=217475 RepID=UPI0025AD75D3|nr:adenylate isopentenyltransferase 5, chloroplastic-like [Arachis stenosperma]
MAPSWSVSSLGKKKVLFIMGTTGSGKSKLSINLGTQFPCEIINSDKIQVYRGLDIVTNKMAPSQQGDIPHHLLSIIDDPDYDFTANEFCKHVHDALELITEKGNIPIIVGGSNSYIEALVNDPKGEFQSKYDCCFIWLDVSLPVLYDYLDIRVDEMVDAGVVDEIRREAFDPKNADYSRGVRRAIGVPELHYYFHILQNDSSDVDEAYKTRVFLHAIDTMKINTHKLAKNQVTKIKRMVNELGWKMTRIDSTQVFEAVLRGEDYNHLYQEIVLKPSVEVVRRFLEY